MTEHVKEVFGCIKNTIRLRSGLYLDLTDPQPDQFEFADIAGALSKICRFGGQIERFYTVAEHSYWCAWQAELDGLPIETQIAVLLHDAAEAFIGDVVKPLKIMLPEYKVIEEAVESAIAEKFKIDFRREEYSITEIDQAMLIAERRVMFSRDGVEWFRENEVRRLCPEFGYWQPGDAETRFVCRARCLGINVGSAAMRLFQ